MIDIITIDEFAALAQLQKNTVTGILRSERATTLPPARRNGRRIYFMRNEVEDWFKSRPVINPRKQVGRPRKTQANLA